MTLQVSFDQFGETVKRLLNLQEAYVAPQGSGTLVTCGKPEKSIVVAALAPTSLDLTKAALTEGGMSVFEGTWLTNEELHSEAEPEVKPYIVAISYRSSGDKAGVWVDAFPTMPTQVAALRSMYDEFRATGEMDDIAFEEFSTLANANVVIVSPTEIDSFLNQKSEC